MTNGQKVKGGVYSGEVVSIREKKVFTKSNGDKCKNWLITFNDGFEGENILPDRPGLVPIFTVGQVHSYKVDFASAFGTEIIPVSTPTRSSPVENNSLPGTPVRDQLPVIALEIAVRMLPENTEELLRDTDVILQWLKDSTK